MRLVKYRPPAVAVVVDDGYIRFCPQCSKVITGRAATTCPYCESALPPPTTFAHEAEGTDSYSVPGQGSSRPRGPLVNSGDQSGASEPAAGGVNRGAPAFVPIMSEEEKSKLSIEELEKVERLEFQAAVAAWRQDRRDDAAGAAGQGESRGKANGGQPQLRRSTLLPVPYYFHLLKEVQKFVEQQQEQQ